MISPAYQVRRLTAQWIFDPVDVYSEARAVAGPHPRPFGPVRFDLIGEMVLGQRQEYDRPIRLDVVFNPSGYAVFLRHVINQADERRRLQLTAGTYIVRASSPHYQLVEREDIVFPQLHPAPGPYLFALEPGYAYPFPKASTLGAGRGPTLLRGSLVTTDQRGIAGAEITVVGQSNTYRTDSTGQWVLVFADAQPAGNVTVRFRLPLAGGGFNTVNVPGIALAQGISNSFLQASITGSVVDAVGVAIPQARVRVLGQPGETRAGNAGDWIYTFPVGPVPNPVDLEAVHPDGNVQVRMNVPVAAGQTTAVEPFIF